MIYTKFFKTTPYFPYFSYDWKPIVSSKNYNIKQGAFKCTVLLARQTEKNVANYYLHQSLNVYINTEQFQKLLNNLFLCYTILKTLQGQSSVVNPKQEPCHASYE
jgi:hypothetical protein